MIKKITKKEYDRVQHNRKVAGAANYPGQYFQAPNGKYYLQTDSGPKAAREVVEFNKKIREQQKKQTTLF
jgi:hypothetical protein